MQCNAPNCLAILYHAALIDPAAIMSYLGSGTATIKRSRTSHAAPPFNRHRPVFKRRRTLARGVNIEVYLSVLSANDCILSSTDIRAWNAARIIARPGPVA